MPKQCLTYDWQAEVFVFIINIFTQVRNKLLYLFQYHSGL